MSGSLLLTKLYVPPLRPSLVPRPRLINSLNQGLHNGHKLSLISAPAGFGKTTLVSEWVATYHTAAAPKNQSESRIAWLSLDEGDNDPTRFLTYLVAALQTITPDLGQGVLAMLQSPQPPAAEAILTPLINEIAAIPDRFILVLDDYHLIDCPPIDDALGFLLEHLPPLFHLVIATRHDPQLPLARLRSRDQLTELRAADLRFSSSEAAEFLNQMMGLGLTSEDIAALETRTEGWIAGLQLAALAMQGQFSRQGARDATSLIESFTGSHRFVLDYLIEEVLEQQSESVQMFLLQTAVLNRLSAPLCNTLTNQNNSQEILEMLEHANLFIIPLDNERRWYRYHHLFDELLQQRLKMVYPEQVNDLHAKAVTWYETNGYLSEAIYHAFASKNIPTAIRLIEKGALDALEQSEFGFIFNAVNRLPDAMLESSSWLFIYYSWALLLTGQIDVVAPRLEHTDWLLDSVSHEDESKKREMLGYVAGLKEQLAGWQRDYASMRFFAQQALENLPENHWICAYVLMIMGTGFWGEGDLTAAYSAFTRAASIGRTSGNKRVAVTGAIYLGHTLDLQGHLRQAAEHFQNSFHLAEQNGKKLPLAAYIHVDFARVLYELNELEQASQHAKEGITLSQLISDSRIEKLGYCFLARVYLAKGDFANAVEAVQKAAQAHPGTEDSVDMRGGEYPHIKVWLKQENFTELESWLNESDINLQNISHFKTRLTYTMHARALIALSRVDPNGTYLNDALNLLNELLALAESNGWGSKVVEILALQALAFDVNGDTAKAIATLKRALKLAKPEEYIRTFVDEGPPMARLLQEAISRGITPKYVHRLLAAFPPDETEQANTTPFPVDQSDLVEPLSDRELEVLQLIAEGLTNPEIASRLYLSLNTVKVHTRNIYSKLDAHNRTQAVAKARALAVLAAV